MKIVRDWTPRRWRARADALSVSLDSRLDLILKWWLLLGGLATTLRLMAVPTGPGMTGGATAMSYFLLIAAPAISTLLALRWFRDGERMAQPHFRFAWHGRWKALTRAEARGHPLYGTGGLLVSLLIGMMLNVPVRAAEYLTAMPPIPEVTPGWLSALHFAMTLDAVLFSSLYMIAFVAALRRVPAFPRLRVAIWAADLLMQIATARMVVAAGPLPASVAVSLQQFLDGNVTKTLISVGLWLPYLLLSKRVNVTYRHRIPV